MRGKEKSTSKPSETTSKLHVKQSFISREPSWLITESVIVAIARICHEANRAWCRHWGSDVQPAWEDSPEWQRTSSIAGVTHIVRRWEEGVEVEAEDLHVEWMKHKLREGWAWAPQKNAERKEHNCLVPYSELNAKERLKDKLFLGIVLSFLK